MVLEGEVLKAYEFLVSLESHVEVTSYFVNDKYVHKYAYYHQLMDDDKKCKVRNIYRKAFNEEFYFTHVDDAIIVPSKANRKNECSEADVKKLYDTYLLEPENESLNDCLSRCMSCWVITRCEESDYKYNCSCPLYCLYGMCKHVIRYSVDKEEFPIPDGCDFRPLKQAAQRGRPKGSGNSYNRED